MSKNKSLSEIRREYSKMTIGIGKYRLMIADYFDSLTSEIDFSIEKELAEYSQDDAQMSEINQKREVYLKEVKESEAINLKHLNEKLHDNLDQLFFLDENTVKQKLMKVFCFTIEYNDLLRLIVTDFYLTQEQIFLYKQAAGYINQLTGFLMEKSVFDNLLVYNSAVSYKF